MVINNTLKNTPTEPVIKSIIYFSYIYAMKHTKALRRKQAQIYLTAIRNEFSNHPEQIPPDHILFPYISKYFKSWNQEFDTDGSMVAPVIVSEYIERKKLLK